jgi:MIP family channel proteins
MERRGTPAFVAELIGTFVLVLSIALAVTVYASGTTNPNVLAIAFVHVFVLTMLIASLGGTSGGHFNPAVSIALCSIRQIAPVDAAIYIVMQLAGGVLAVLVAKALIQNGASDAVNFGAVAVSPTLLNGSGAAAFLAEFIGTFLLMWAIMGAAVNPASDKSWAPFVIGLTLGLGVALIAPMTGAGFNPARSFGPALVTGEFGPAGTFLLAYIVAPIIAALVAAMAYRAIVLEPPAAMRPVDKLGEPEA